MPEEGLSKSQKHQLAQMEYAKKMQAKDKEVRGRAVLGGLMFMYEWFATESN